MTTIQSLLEKSPYVLADGAMGTMLFAAGLENGGSPELWNVEHPEKVAAVHRAYLEAGSRLLLTNTFGGTRLRLRDSKYADRAPEARVAGTVHLPHSPGPDEVEDLIRPEPRGGGERQRDASDVRTPSPPADRFNGPFGPAPLEPDPDAPGEDRGLPGP